jgi:hypothetical protein
MLKALNEKDLKCVISSNRLPKFLVSAGDNAVLSDVIVNNYAVNKLGVHKPTLKVFQMAYNGLNDFKERVLFMSFNAWDAAAFFEICVSCVNRFVKKKERLPIKPELRVLTSSSLPPMFGL